jgi:hypothetical protein
LCVILRSAISSKIYGPGFVNPNSLDSICTSAIRFSSFRRSAAIKKMSSSCTWDSREYTAQYVQSTLLESRKKREFLVYTVVCLARKLSKHWKLNENFTLDNFPK